MFYTKGAGSRPSPFFSKKHTIMKKINIYLLITALLLIALGVVCILNPGASFASAAWIMGLFILASGVSSLIFGLRAQAFLPNAGSTTLLAIFQIIVGLMLATNILVSQVALIAVFSMWVLFEGVSLAVLSIDYKKGGYDRWWLMLLLGVCSIILGFLALREGAHCGLLRAQAHREPPPRHQRECHRNPHRRVQSSQDRRAIKAHSQISNVEKVSASFPKLRALFFVSSPSVGHNMIYPAIITRWVLLKELLKILF